MRKALLLTLLVFSVTLCFAQKAFNNSELETKLFKPYTSYFGIDREWVYTHLNKSAYLQGDDIWFTSYVVNPANRKLNFATSKLYVELWSPEKKMISRKILLVNAGTANHYIHLGDSLSPGTYCFRAYTSWMQNFYQENDLNTYIKVIGKDKTTEATLGANRKTKTTDIKSIKNSVLVYEARTDYDIQFLPESGTFLEGVYNVLGIKATDSNGKGVIVTGNIYSADRQEITSFATNEYGMNSITIPEVTKEQYLVKVILPDSTTRDFQLPKAESQGVIILVNTFRSDEVWFSLQTNETTRQLNKSYTIMIHANGILFNTYHVAFSKTNAVLFKIKKKDIEGGIIYATVFDENMTPVAERVFFNRLPEFRGNLSLNAEAMEKDTVNLKVVIKDSLDVTQFSKLSISVLPDGTLLNQFDNSLLSESILRPALYGNIENPNYYFDKTDFEHSKAIDNLLLTQGWRKYDWPAILKDTIHKFAFPIENGYAIEGKVKNWLKNKPELKSIITLLSPANGIFLLTSVDSLGSFKFDNVYLKDSTWIIAAASSAKGVNWNRVLQISIPEFFTGIPDFPAILTFPEKNKEIFSAIPQFIKGEILLEEIVVTAKKKNPFEDNINISMMDRTLEITAENYNKFSNIEMLLMMQFNIRTERTQDGEYHFNMGRGNSSFSGTASEPIMMIDGMKVRDPHEILNFPLELVEAVAVNKSGLGGGMEGSAGTIAIKSRTTPLFVNNSEATNIKRLMVKGYAAPAKFFVPKYIIYPGRSEYSKYATIFWKPDLLIDKNNIGSFRCFVPNEIKTVNIRVEGISFNGKVFLHEQNIALPGRN